MEIKKLFDYEIIQEEDVEITGTSKGDLLISPTTGGRFYGEELNGTLLPVGIGTTYTHGTENDIRSTTLLRTDDGSDILMDMKAFLSIPEDVEERLMRGEHTDDESYYYKGIVSFQTGSEKYKWLERKVCVCECVIHDWTRLTTSVYMVI